MKIFRKSDLKIFKTGEGEQIAQYSGRLEKHGSTKGHSLAVMTLDPDASSQKHHHKVSEESFLIVKGKVLFSINEEVFECSAGDCVLVKATEMHWIKNITGETVEIVICTSPAWNPEDSYSQ